MVLCYLSQALSQRLVEAVSVDILPTLKMTPRRKLSTQFEQAPCLQGKKWIVTFLSKHMVHSSFWSSFAAESFALSLAVFLDAILQEGLGGSLLSAAIIIYRRTTDAEPEKT